MNDTQIRKFDKLQRQDVYMKDSAADFPANSAGDKTAVFQAALIVEIQQKAAAQTSGFNEKRQAFVVKKTGYKRIDTILDNISLAADGLVDEFPGIEAKFRRIRKPTEQSFMAQARAFLADAAEYKNAMIAQGLDADFLVQLADAITEFEQAAANADSAEEAHAAATGALNDAFKRGIANSKKMDSAIKLKYRENPGKLAAWTVASHLERAPKRNPKPTT